MMQQQDRFWETFLLSELAYYLQTELSWTWAWTEGCDWASKLKRQAVSSCLVAAASCWSNTAQHLQGGCWC